MKCHGRLFAFISVLVSLILFGCNSYSSYDPVRLGESGKNSGNNSANQTEFGQNNQYNQLNGQRPQTVVRDTSGFPMSQQPNEVSGQNPRNSYHSQPDITADNNKSYYEVYNPSHPNADSRGYVRYYPHPPVNEQPVTSVGQTNNGQYQTANTNGQNSGYWSHLPTRQQGYEANHFQTPNVTRVQPSNNPYNKKETIVSGEGSPGGSAIASVNVPDESNSISVSTQNAVSPALQPIVQVGGVTGALAANPSSTRLNPNKTMVARIDDPPTIPQVTYYLERLVSENPQDISAQLALRLMYAAQGDADRALKTIPSVPDDLQNSALDLARAVVLTSRTIQKKDDPVVANKALEALEALHSMIAERADLRIENLKICSDVSGFGQYNELDPQALTEGQGRSILVYCELENFTNGLNADNQYYTSIHASITLYDSGLNALTQLSAPVVDKPSYNKRRDFYLRGPLQLPKLSPGKYEIVTVIEDKLANKRALPWRYEFEVKGNPTSVANIP